MSSLEKAKQWQKISRSTKDGYLRSNLAKIKSRCKKNYIPFDLTHEFLKSIATDTCPIFGIKFIWRAQGTGKGPKENTPSLDRVIPHLGYVQGNVVFISSIANTIKQNVTEKELYAVADWLHDKRKEVLNAFKDKPAPIPKPPDTPGRKSSSHGTVHGAGAGEDCDGAQHYQGELFGENTDHCPYAGSRIRVGPGMPKVGTPQEPEGYQSAGDS